MILPIIQIVLSVLLVAAILLQQSDAGLGSAFGSDDGGVHRTRRGAEKILFYSTIILAVLFVLSCVFALVV